MSPDPIPAPSSRSALELFRTRTTRQRIHAAETVLLWLVCANVCLLPWAIGGMRLWAQLTSFGLALAAFVWALRPRDYEASPAQAAFRLYTWPKLARFPLFWLGLAFLTYCVIGALNPAWSYTTDGKGWWMVPVDHASWLPAGVRAPFVRWGPWQMIMIYASVWLAASAVWAGFTRRKTAETFFTVLAANAVLLAGVGIVERALNARLVLWFFPVPEQYFVSTFIYKNHAGAFFNLLLSLCAGLAFWHYEQSQRRLDKSSPAGVFAFCGTAVAMIVFFSYSRTATVLMFAFLAVTFAIFVRRMFFVREADSRTWLMTALLVIAFVAFARIGLTSLKIERFVERMADLEHTLQEERPGARTLAAKATLDMARDRLATGWGASSFEFMFPRYQQRYPEIYTGYYGRLLWQHAHNDYAEFLAEFGVIGCSLLLAGLGYSALRLIRLRVWENTLALFVVMGLGLVLVHSVVDFNFYNPAILLTWCVLAVAILRWLELEEAR